MNIAIPIFDRLTALDAVGPYEVLSRLPGAKVHFVAARGRTEANRDTDAGADRRPHARRAARSRGDRRPRRFRHARADGGRDDARLVAPRRTRRRSGRPRCARARCCSPPPGSSTASRRPPTGWRSRRSRSYGATPGQRRVVVEQGKVITAAGVSAGIDMALTLAARIAGEEYAQAIQLGIEYDPQPPFDGGSAAKAPPEIVELVRGGRRACSPEACARRRHRSDRGSARPRPGRDRRGGRARAPRLAATRSGRRTNTWSTSWPPDPVEPVERQRAQVEVAAEHARRAVRPARASCAPRARLAPRRRRRCGRWVQVADPASRVAEPDAACTQRRSGSQAQPPRPVLGDRAAADQDRVGAATVGLDQSPASASRSPGAAAAARCAR